MNRSWFQRSGHRTYYQSRSLLERMPTDARGGRFIVVLFGAVWFAWAANSLADDQRPAYRLTEGMGYTVCEAYLRNLRAFGPGERDPVCNPRPHPGNKNFSEPTWQQMDVQQNLKLIYQAEITGGIYLAIRSDSRDTSNGAKPSRQRSRPAQSPEPEARASRFRQDSPVDVVAYSRNPDGCEADFKRFGASENTGYRWFFYDEATNSLNEMPQGPEAILPAQYFSLEGTPFCKHGSHRRSNLSYAATTARPDLHDQSVAAALTQ